MFKKATASLLTVFLFCGIFSITTSARSKEIEKQLVEIWRSGDEEALEQYYDEYYWEVGGIADTIWKREEVEAFRNAENKLFVIKLDFDREAFVQSEYGKYFLDFEKSKEYADAFGKYSVTAVMEDGSLQQKTIDTRERVVYTVKELLRDFGIDDPSEIGLIRGSQCWFDYGEIDRSELMEYTPGWNEIDGNRYYIKSDGTVLTKSATIGGIRYKFGKDGVCQGTYTGKARSGNNVVCYKDGIKQEDGLFTGWIKFGGKRFYAEDGVIQTGWVNISPDWYYIDPKEGRLTGTHEIDGASCTFDKNGKWDKKTIKSADSVYNYVENKMDKSLYGGVYWRDGMVMVWSVDGKAEKKLQKRYPNNGGIFYMEAKYSVAEMIAIPQQIRAQNPDGITSYYVDVFNNRLKLGFTKKQLKRIQPYLDSLENKDCIDLVDETGVIFYDD